MKDLIHEILASRGRLMKKDLTKTISMVHEIIRREARIIEAKTMTKG